MKKNFSEKNLSDKISHRKKGIDGEALAEKFLLEKGYKILAKNYRYGRFGEIDIVALDCEILVFVEVKLRKNFLFGTPEESVNLSKQNKLRLTAENFLFEKNFSGHECRFDVIAIDALKEKFEIRHILNAF